MGIVFYLIGGFIGGFSFAMMYDMLHKTYGVIEVDHKTNSCRVRMTSNDLSNRKNKKAVFKIDHDVIFSRDEQSL